MEYAKLLGKTAGQASTSESQSSLVVTARKRTQPRIDNYLHAAAEDAYRKLIKSAYILAVDGLTFGTFKTLVRVQKANGTCLIEGTESCNKAKEFIRYLAEVIRAKITVTLSSSTAFSILSDGSPARKTGNEKELVMVRVVKDGRPVYFVVALEDIDSFGDATAENLHKSIDHAFQQNLKIANVKYTKALVSATADGASVNTGQ